ncbi:hypothetical protein BJ508DRAFT_60666 [Ascobolus immersus RN42]|uniref:Uncharacterized protein n=1 Tax=Ascobolus immersus RN42 TaxID=1160509 RepID=A0A3N4J0P4_ASCIM|nr:hypothetical protein BJ508DRAFT_60666 [Ascobolus immersus RN42]
MLLFMSVSMFLHLGWYSKRSTIARATRPVAHELERGVGGRRHLNYRRWEIIYRIQWGGRSCYGAVDRVRHHHVQQSISRLTIPFTFDIEPLRCHEFPDTTRMLRHKFRLDSGVVVYRRSSGRILCLSKVDSNKVVVEGVAWCLSRKRRHADSECLEGCWRVGKRSGASSTIRNAVLGLIAERGDFCREYWQGRGLLNVVRKCNVQVVVFCLNINRFVPED